MADAPGVSGTSLDGNEVVLERGNSLEEWYGLGELGLEHGFTVYELPPGAPGASTNLVMRVTADGVKPVLVDGGLELVASDGEAAGGRLKYGEAFAMDAYGSELPVSLSTAGDSILISVSTDGAQLPIVIDPLVWKQHNRITAGQFAANDDSFGTSIATNLTTTGGATR
ncbi:MAG: hypothetical protein WKF41_18300, partial [Gaiellaceae bacterium]